MIASIWSFALGCVAFLWGMASIFLPITMTRTLDGGYEIDPSRAVVAIVPVVIMTLAAACLTWYAVKNAAGGAPGRKFSSSRGLSFSGLALSLIGLAIALSFSYIW
jgi:hypothetical protein